MNGIPCTLGEAACSTSISVTTAPGACEAVGWPGAFGFAAWCLMWAAIWWALVWYNVNKHKETLR